VIIVAKKTMKETMKEMKEENEVLKAQLAAIPALEQQLAKMQLTQRLLEQHANTVIAASQALLRDVEALNKAAGGQG
jgi:hypothetical protein